MKYDRNGLDLIIEFSAKLQRKESEWAFELVKNNMEEIYDASGYGWDDDDKRKELTEQVIIFYINRLTFFFLIYKSIFHYFREQGFCLSERNLLS